MPWRWSDRGCEPPDRLEQQQVIFTTGYLSCPPGPFTYLIIEKSLLSTHVIDEKTEAQKGNNTFQRIQWGPIPEYSLGSSLGLKGSIQMAPRGWAFFLCA